MTSISIKYLVEEHKYRAPTESNSGFMETTERLSDTWNDFYSIPGHPLFGHNSNLNKYLQSNDQLSNAGNQCISVKPSHRNGTV
jgi:hypothetical protein